MGDYCKFRACFALLASVLHAARDYRAHFWLCTLKKAVTVQLKVARIDNTPTEYITQRRDRADALAAPVQESLSQAI